MKSIFRFLFITSIILIAGCENSKFVARVGNSAIYVKDFKAALLKEKGIKSYDNVSLRKKENILDTMIEKKLQLLDAYRNNLDQDSTICDAVQKSEKRYVYDAVLENQIISKVITGNDLKDRYDKMSREVKIQHIFLPYRKTDDEKQKQSIKNRLDSLRSLILRGEKFATLARKFSRDSLSAGKGGDLGFIKWDDSKYNDNFYKHIFNTKKGDVSNVFETNKGFHLVKVLQSRPVPVEPYDIQKPIILKTFFRERTNELNKDYYDFLEKLEKKHPVTFNDENIQYFIDFVKQEMDSLEKQGKQFNINNILDRIDVEKPLFEFNRKQYSIKKFVADLKSMYPMYYPGIYSSKKVNDNLKRLSSREAVVDYGYIHGYNKKKAVREKILQRKEDLMVKKINDLKTNSDLEKDDLKNYYEKNQEIYSKPDKYKVREIRVKDKEQIEKIYNKAIKSENFESLSITYNENEKSKIQKGVLGYIHSKQYGTIGKTAATLEINEISKPFEFDGYYVIIKVLDIIPGELTPFDETNRNLVITLKKQMVKEKKENWLKELNVLYPVIKYENKIENVFKKKEII